MGGLDLLFRIGIWVGVIAYIGKVIVFHMAFPRLMKWVHAHTLALAIMDFSMTALAHYLIGGSSNMAMLSIISFGGCSTIYISFFGLKNWVTKKFKEWDDHRKEVNNAKERSNKPASSPVHSNGSTPDKTFASYWDRDSALSYYYCNRVDINRRSS